MDGDRLYVGQSGLQHFTGTGMQMGSTAGMPGGTHTEARAEDAARVPLMEERLNVEKRPVDMGEVQVRKAVLSEQVDVPIELTREEAVIEKQAVVTGEVVGLDHDQGVRVHHTASGVPDWDEVSATRRQDWERRYGSSGRRWQDVEPGHHYAHEMSGDERYRGRPWTEVEPELRAGYGDWSRRRGYADVPGEDAWQRLHQEVREAWDESHARTR